MKTVHEVSRLTGVSIRTLHYYDEIGLLSPVSSTEAGYRLYDDSSLERLQQILLFRELQFPLKEIKTILDSPGFDRKVALDQQIRLLELRKEHIENLIDLARGIRMIGVKNMSFDAFDTKKIDEYARQAKETWGKTDAYREFEQKTKGQSPEEMKETGVQLVGIIAAFGEMKQLPVTDPTVQMQVRKLQDFITEHYYHCTDEILASLGHMYAGGGSMTENINAAGGAGCAEYACEAILAAVGEK